MKKRQIIQHLINIAINHNWEGNKADGERWEMTKFLRKKKKKDLIETLKR